MMERIANSEFIDLDDESPMHSSDGSVTLVQAEEASKKAEIALRKQGRKLHSNAEVEELYLQQRAAAPKQDIFK